MSKRNTQNNSALTDDERAIKQALKQHLDTEVENLDFNITSKLAAARNRALAQEISKPAWQNLFGWPSLFSWQTMAGGLAAVTMAYVISGQLQNTTRDFDPTNQTPVIAETPGSVLMEDMTILAEGDDIEFYQNIEFLEWLESNS